MDKMNSIGQQYQMPSMRHQAMNSKQAEHAQPSQRGDHASLHSRPQVAQHVLFSSVQRNMISVSSGNLTPIASQIVDPKSVEPKPLFDSEEVANNVLSYVASALKKASSDGASQEKLDQLMLQARAGVDQGFADARTELEDSDMLDDEIKAGIDKSYDLIQNGLEDIADGDYSILEKNKIQQEIAASDSRSTSIELETTDGDKVSISFSQMQQFEYSQRQSEGERSFSVSMQQELNYSISIQGDLDDDELAAIQSLIEDVSKMGKSFFDGDMEKAYEQALEIGFDDEQLLGVAINMEHTQTVSASNYSNYASENESPLSSLIPNLSQFLQELDEVEQKAKPLFSDPEEAIASITSALFEQRQTMLDSIDEQSKAREDKKDDDDGDDAVVKNSNPLLEFLERIRQWRNESIEPLTASSLDSTSNNNDNDD
ncbi:hypothetical protein DBZ36_18760 [Alginatibacterium sediminis]|uniref:DUF5610 domain-containing protein n=1 Tax=Alginatibacterium sediminis TaxID=2164068 RepID=A0A420E5W9_9ALTE|nr:DUF5610 domain-containing protein [Alginatibacterium sediminis]RKF13110.1 hypothetical protein DBZ36_18760 [Alginatibacterium sediminis]